MNYEEPMEDPLAIPSLPVQEVNIKKEIIDDDISQLEDNKIDVQETIVRIKEEVKQEVIDDADDWEGKIKVHAVGPSEENCDEIVEEDDMKAADIEEDEEYIEPVFCGRCTDEERWYCLKCPMVTRILDNNFPNNTTDDKSKATLPKKILEIKEISDSIGVYALKTLREGLIFGPFEGINSVPSTNGCYWRLKSGIFADVDDSHGSNWMQFINYADNVLNKNLDIFQYKENLFYQTCKEIEIGEELLIYLNDKQGINENNEAYYKPNVIEINKKTYACTLCSLGYSSNVDLKKHKVVCVDESREVVAAVEEIVQCVFCKIFMEKWEFLKYHLDSCFKNRQRQVLYPKKEKQTNDRKRRRRLEVKNQLMDEKRDGSIEQSKKIKCPKCPFETKNKRSLGNHSRVHKIGNDDKLNEYKCSKCPYKTLKETSFKKHCFTHETVNQMKCSLCYNIRFSIKQDLEQHIKDKHATLYCAKCEYQTYNKFRLRRHVLIHRDEKIFACTNCEQKFTTEHYLKTHIRNQHKNNEEFKPYICQVCKKRFTSPFGLNAHIKTKHGGVEKCPNCTENKGGKDNTPCKLCDLKPYKCTQCVYATDIRRNLTQHMYIHDDVKPFQCEVCGKQFTSKGNLRVHMRSHNRVRKTKKQKITLARNRKHKKKKISQEEDENI